MKPNHDVQSVFVCEQTPSTLLVRLRRNLSYSALFSLVLFLLMALPLSANASELTSDRSALPPSPEGLDLIMQGASHAQGPQITSPYAALFTRDGIELFSRGGDVQRAMASTTKMTTALVVDNAVRQGKISYQQMVRVPREALIEEASIGLKAGDQLTLSDLMQGALVHSGNDAATALGLTQAPQVASFAEMMNDYVTTDLHLTHTHYVNPHGLDAPQHYSCARDLALIGSEVLRRPQLAAIVRKPYARIVINGNPQTIDSTFADALNFSPRVDGIKTGYTDNAGGCLVLAAHKDGMGLVAVVMGSTLEKRQEEALTLLTWGFNQLPKKAYASKSQVVATVPVGLCSGYKVRVCCDDNVIFRSLGHDEGGLVKEHLHLPQFLPWSAVASRQPIGSIAWTQEGKFLGATTLKVVGTPFVEPARLPWQRLVH